MSQFIYTHTHTHTWLDHRKGMAGACVCVLILPQLERKCRQKEVTGYKKHYYESHIMKNNNTSTCPVLSYTALSCHILACH